MNKLLTKVAKLALGLSLAAGVGVAIGSKAAERVDGAETVAYTLETVKGGSNTAYGTYYNVTINGKEWSAPGNQNFTGYWRIGGKYANNSSDISRTITGKSTISQSITKVTVNHNGFSRNTISSGTMTLTSATDSNFTANIKTSTVTPTIAQSTASSFSFEEGTTTGWGENRYYKINFSLENSGTDNGGLDITSIVFYYDNAGGGGGSSSGTAVYTVSSKTAMSSSGGPSGSSVSYSQTYGTVSQATSGNSFTVTLSGYGGTKITGASVKVHSNSSGGGGSLSLVSGTSTIASISDSKFNTENWNGAWSTTYVDKDLDVTDTVIANSATIVLTISATANSLFFSELSLEWEDAGDTPATPNLSLDKVSVTIGLESTATFVVSASNLTSTFTVESGDTDYVTVSSISPTASADDGDYTVTLYGKAVTSTGVTITVASTGATTRTLTANVEILPLIDTNLNSVTWDSIQYAGSPHTVTWNSNYQWVVSAGQLQSSVGYLGSNSTHCTVASDDFTLKDTSILSAIPQSDLSTYAAAFYMSNFGVVHPTKFSVNPGTVNAIGATRDWYILASVDSGDTWSIIQSGSDIQASTEMVWSNASTYSSTSTPVQFGFLMTYSSSKTIANIAIKVFADSYATTKVLQSIYVSGTPTKSYYVGQSFSLGTAKVYARYTDQTTYPDEDISSHVTWTSLEHGTTSVTGTYAGKEVEITGLTVRDEGSVYKKVTSVNELIEGAKVVIGTSNGAYVACAQSTNNKNRKSEAAGGEYGYYDSGDVLNYSVNTTVFTIGITSYGFTFNDGTGYLYAGSNSENILRVETELDENHNGEWSITITDGIATITSLGSHTHNTINGNNDVFSAYQSPTVTVSLYADVAGTVQAFIDNYLHTEIAYNPDPTLPINNAGSCEDSDWYVDAKSVLVGLGSDYIEEFQGNDDFANALARYNAWAAACGDTTPFAGSGIVSARTSVLLGKIDNTATITLIVIISMVSVTAIGGYFFIRRRKAN